jgi:hypothetical protein
LEEKLFTLKLCWLLSSLADDCVRNPNYDTGSKWIIQHALTQLTAKHWCCFIIPLPVRLKGYSRPSVLTPDLPTIPIVTLQHKPRLKS